MGKKSKQQQKAPATEEDKAPENKKVEEEVKEVKESEPEAKLGFPDIQDSNIVSITIIDLNKREINLKMVQNELIMELREFLGDHINTCFFTNYILEHNGV